MPALDNYNWRQKNPWLWGAPYGSGSSGVSGVLGPYMAFGVQFWIRTADCAIGFDVDSDPDPDLFQSKQQICDNPRIEDRVKLAMSAQLEAVGCGKLPCVEESE